MKYLCSYCNTFVYDEERGEERAGLKMGIKLPDIPENWRCPVCGQPKFYLKPISDSQFQEKKKTYDKLFPQIGKSETKAGVKSEIKSARPAKAENNDEAAKGVMAKAQDIVSYRDKARIMLAGVCSANKVCDGNPDRLCMGIKYGKPIGFGGAGQGRTFDANFKALEKYKFRMRVIKEHHEPELETKFLGKKIAMPIMSTSFSGVRLSMNDSMPEAEFQRGMIEGAKLFGTIGLSGNTVDYPDHPGIEIIKENDGWGIPVFKPQSQERLLQLFKRAEAANVIAIGVDLDGYGSKNWEYRGKPLYRKSEKELRELVNSTGKPVILKGVMTVEDAAIVYDTGAKAVDVSNHGGRVLDYGQGVADVLPDIAKEFKGKITIMADGAVRTGYDALKLLALGADVVLIGRELARMSLAGGAPAVKAYLDFVKADLRGGMIMTGCDSLKEIRKEILVKCDK